MLKKIAQLTGHNAAIFSVAQSRDEQHFLSAAGDGWVVEWDFENPDPGKLVAKVDVQIFAACFLPKENLVVAGNMNGGIHWADLNHPEKSKNVAHHKKGVFEIRQLGQHLFTAGGEGMLTKWSIEEKRTLESYHLANQAIRCFDYSEIRNEIAIGASDNAIYFLDAGSLELKHVLQNAHANSVFSVRYCPEGKRLFSGGRDAHLNVWDLQNFEKTASLPAHLYTINCIAFHPEGHLFATASRDRTIKIWDAEKVELLKVLDTQRDGGHGNSVNKLYWSAWKNTLISCSDDRSIILWR